MGRTRYKEMMKIRKRGKIILRKNKKKIQTVNEKDSINKISPGKRQKKGRKPIMK